MRRNQGMDFDLVIRNGSVVDGSGAPARRADVAIVGSRIAAIGEVEGSGSEEIDADGLIVAPGFVDGHTHMDAQVFWDDLGTSSCWHGVTSVVTGNCGFTLAPASKEQSALVVRNLERAEDISGDAMREGIRWTWTTFREYLDAVDALPKGLNYASAIGHSALRTYVMGERAFTETATADDVEAMERELMDALRAGAAGFSTSRSNSHETSDDRPVASRVASEEELRALVTVVGRESDGIFQITGGGAAYSPDPEIRARHFAGLRDLAVETGVPITFGIFAGTYGNPAVETMKETAARGGHMYGLTHCRGVGVLLSFRTRLPFDNLPEWSVLRSKPLDEQRRLLEDPDIRARLVHLANHGSYGRAIGAEARRPDWNRLHVVQSPYLPNPTVAQEAARRGIDPVELMIDLALASNFEVFFQQFITPEQPEDDLVRLFRSPYCAMTFTDSGAHVSQVLDSSLPSHLLAYWVRERGALTVEEAIRAVAAKPAEIWRLHDRGLLREGCAADVTIIDLDRVAPNMPQIVDDLPGGSRRLVQTAEGFVATVVNGQVLTRDGKATDARPGRLLRRPPKV
jgi:N-acyl-D-aspartate/D-glutamate deacylase